RRSIAPGSRSAFRSTSTTNSAAALGAESARASSPCSLRGLVRTMRIESEDIERLDEFGVRTAIEKVLQMVRILCRAPCLARGSERRGCELAYTQLVVAERPVATVFRRDDVAA